MILRRSRFDGLPSGTGVTVRISFRSSAILVRDSRLDSVSRYRVCATLAGPRIFAQLQNLDLKLATFRGYSQQVANMNIAGRLAWLPVRPNPA